MEEYTKHKLVKETGIYICPDPIQNFKIRIRVREDTSPNSFKTLVEKEFYWQEKHFNREQKEYYRDERNCFTDKERQYNRMICEEDQDDDFLFTYCHEDQFYPDNEEIDYVSHLSQYMTNLNIVQESSRQDKKFDYFSNLQKSVDNPGFQLENWETMCIMADFGTFLDNIWIKNEKLLCSIKYNQSSKVLKVYPDFTNTHPYTLKIQSDKERIYSYFIENCSNSIPESIETNEKTLIKNINDYKVFLKNQLLTEPFALPPRNKLRLFLFMDICSGKGFEYPDVHVQYSIHLPDDWNSPDPDSLGGRTHLCRANNDEGLVHFGHSVEIVLEYDFMSLETTEYTKSPFVYFEIISKDSWDRYRTEGLCYINLPMSHSGGFTYDLRCFRFTSPNPVNEMKRFFIGDCKNYTNIDWIAIPTTHESSELNKYGTHTLGTGQLKVKLNIVHQSQEFMENDTKMVTSQTKKLILDRLGSSSLIRNVEQIIQEFKQARKEMLEAKKNI